VHNARGLYQRALSVMKMVSYVLACYELVCFERGLF